MSKERDLLKDTAHQLEAAIACGHFPNAHVLLNRITELLGEPEEDAYYDGFRDGRQDEKSNHSYDFCD